MTLLQRVLLAAFFSTAPISICQTPFSAPTMAEVEHAYAVSTTGTEDRFTHLIRSQVSSFQDGDKARASVNDPTCPPWLLASTADLASTNPKVHELQTTCADRGVALGRVPADVAGRTYAYDSVIASLVAGVETRSYSRGSKLDWSDTSLAYPPDGTARYYQQNVPAHFHQGDNGDHRLFVLLNSSYSTWKRGTWTNKTVAALRAAFPSCHILVIAGFLTPEVLASRPRMPDLTGELTARDLYVRIAAWTAQTQHSGALPSDLRTGLIGFSGGANIVMSLLQEDGIHNGGGKALLFSMGGAAFSPIVDLPGTFHVLDGSSKAILASGFPEGDGLTTISNMFGLALEGYLPSRVTKFLGLFSDRPDVIEQKKSFINRFYREFEIVDLQSVIKAPYLTKPTCAGNLDFSGYYERCVFPWYTLAGYRPRAGSVADYADMGRMTSKIRAPMYVVFALDDPVLSHSDVDPRIRGDHVREGLKTLAMRPNVRVFAPEQGGHLGYMLDSMFVYQALKTFFSRN